jgi:hypothetical protein
LTVLRWLCAASLDKWLMKNSACKVPTGFGVLFWIDGFVVVWALLHLMNDCFV